MLNVGGSVPRQGPLVRGLTIAFNKCPPLLEGNQWRHVKKKPIDFYLANSSCANVLQCGKVKVACKFK